MESTTVFFMFVTTKEENLEEQGNLESNYVSLIKRSKIEKVIYEKLTSFKLSVDKLMIEAQWREKLLKAFMAP